MTELKPGDAIRTISFKAIHGAKVKGQEWAEFTFKAPAGKRFVLVLLGAENADGTSPLDVNKALEALGWRFEAP